MKHKIVENGVITNIIECDEDFAISVGAVLALEDDFIGKADSFIVAKQQKLQSLKAWHDQQIEAMKTKYSQAEIDSFLDKRNEAMAWRVDSTAPTPYVNAMANGNAEVRLMLLNSILAKVDATAQLEIKVLLLRDAIEASTTQAELDAVVF